MQETRHWDEAAGITQSMRAKEGSSDYRYFPEPDLLPIVVDEAWREQILATLPELPAARKARYEELGVDADNAATLASGPPEFCGLFDVAVGMQADPKVVANWLTGEVTAYLRREGSDPVDLPLTGEHLAELSGMVVDGTVSATAAKEVLTAVMAGEGGPGDVAEARDLIQISDVTALAAAVDEVIAANEDQFRRFAAGEDKVMGFFVGQVMRATSGKADPKLVNQILRQRAGR